MKDICDQVAKLLHTKVSSIDLEDSEDLLFTAENGTQVNISLVQSIVTVNGFDGDHRYDLIVALHPRDNLA